MPKLLSVRHIISVLEDNGFKFISQKGSHSKYRKAMEKNKSIIVIVPIHGTEIPISTFMSIIIQSGLKKKDFQ